MDNAALDASGEGREDVASVALIPKSAKLALLWSSGRLDVYEQNGERVAHAYSTHDACEPTASPTVNAAAAAPAPATPARSRSRGKKAAVEPAAQHGASTSSLPRIDVPPSGVYVAILSTSDKDTGVMSYSILNCKCCKVFFWPPCLFHWLFLIQHSISSYAKPSFGCIGYPVRSSRKLSKQRRKVGSGGGGEHLLIYLAPGPPGPLRASGGTGTLHPRILVSGHLFPASGLDFLASRLRSIFPEARRRSDMAGWYG